MEDQEALMGNMMSEKVDSDKFNDKEKECCCCCPIKCGVTTIGILTIVYLFVEIIVIACYSASAYFDMYYWMVCLLLITPAIVAVVFWFIYWCFVDSEDQESEDGGRKRLVAAVWLTLAAAILLFFWNIIYIFCLYDYDEVYVGYGQPAEPGSENDTNENYYKVSKSDYVLEALFEAILVIGLFSYFVCVIHNYANLTFSSLG